MVIPQRPKWLLQERSLGLKADDLDIGVTFSNVSDAETNAKLLFSRGYRRVQIFDRETHKPVENFRP